MLSFKKYSVLVLSFYFSNTFGLGTAAAPGDEYVLQEVLDERMLAAPAKVCDGESRLMLAVRCNDGTEKLLCSPMAGIDSSSSVCSSVPNDQWADAKCNGNGGFDQVLPYYSGCYPKTIDFWKDYAPDSEFPENEEDEEGVCEADIGVPALNLKNLNFEDDGLNIQEWDQEVFGPWYYVRQKLDGDRCASRGRCLAYEGKGYALISAGESQHWVTPPNMLHRDDFRIPEVDPDVCTPTKFCFSFAMRFISKEVAPVEETGKDDFFTVEVQVNGDGEMLFEETIRVSDVEQVGGDSGWQHIEIELPQATLGNPTFFTFRAMTTNLLDYALDSVGYIDALNIAACS